VNAGTISTAGNATINALGTITNSTSGTISAQTLSLATSSGMVFNQGSMQAVNALNIASPASDLIVNNAGTFAATKGAINFSGSGNFDMNGGNLLSRVTNIDFPNGIVNVGVDQVTGVVNVTAGGAHVTANTPDLKLGSVNVPGDPSYFNVGGSLSISNISNTAGQDLSLVASQDVIVSGGKITTTRTSGNGGNLNIIAGAQITSAGAQSSTVNPGNNTAVLSVLGPSPTGGAINLSGVTSINTNGTSSTANGGNIQMIAYSGSGQGSLLPAGTINLGTAAIKAGGGAAGTNGNVTIIAGETGGTAVTANGSISSNTGTSGGNVSITAATPVITNSGSIVTIQKGAITAGAFGLGTIQNSAIVLGPGASIHGNAVSLTTGNAPITLGDGSSIAAATAVSVSTNNKPISLGNNVAITSGGSISLASGTGPTSAISMGNNTTVSSGTSLSLTGKSVTLGSGTQVNGGTTAVIESPNLLLGSGSIVSGNNSLLIDSSSYSTDMTITGTYWSSATLASNGTTTITPASGHSLYFASSPYYFATTLNISGALVTTCYAQRNSA
jgi:hypothetical protein